MPLFVTPMPGTDKAFTAEVEQELEVAKRETPADEKRFVNLDELGATVFVPTEKQHLSSDWQVLEPEHRPSDEIFHRYRVSIEEARVHGEQHPARLLGRTIAEFLHRK